MTEDAADFAAGAAYLDRRIAPIGDARIPVTDWGYRRSDVTDDVVGFHGGAFFLGNDRPGPISSRLRATFWAKRAEGWHATPVVYHDDQAGGGRRACTKSPRSR